MTTKKRKEDTVTAPTLAPAEEAPVTFGRAEQAAKAIGRTLTDFADLRDRGGFIKPFPSPNHRGEYDIHGEDGVVAWAVWAGYLTDDGRVLVGYEELVPLAGWGSRETGRSALWRRRDRIKRTGKESRHDIPEPFDHFQTGQGGPRPMWLLEEQIRPWLAKGREDRDGNPTRLNIGGRPPGRSNRGT